MGEDRQTEFPAADYRFWEDTPGSTALSASGYEMRDVFISRRRRGLDDI